MLRIEMGRSLWTTIGIAALTFGVGVAVGRSLASKAPEPVTSSSAVVVAPTPTSDPLVVETAPLAELQHDAAVVIALPATSQYATKIGSPTLPSSDERSLVDNARTALSRGRPSDALRITEQHENLFPRGELSEDSDFLHVSALRDLGRMDEASSRARMFVAMYPHSALSGALQPLLISAPVQQVAAPPPPAPTASAVPQPDPAPTETAEQMDPNTHGAY